MDRLNLLQCAALVALGSDRVTDHPKEPIPDKLDINTDHLRYCMQFDVYFNGVKQTRCIVADVKNGRILRYKHSIGRTPVRNRRGKYDTEMLEGVVKIVRKGDAVPRSDTSTVT